ncbi:hypothetical protein [Sphingobacterium sp.]|uniref:hypothetical protein n=1 Tax=Sphingobacterium sp. TaxID=341027 RepID=UPI0025DB9135|nr:hypothetical protein [Sphingobacterium sp.]
MKISNRKTKKNESTKKKYVAPKIELVLHVDMEESIATSSAIVIPGGTTNTPQVTDWEERKIEKDWNF